MKPMSQHHARTATKHLLIMLPTIIISSLIGYETIAAGEISSGVTSIWVSNQLGAGGGFGGGDGALGGGGGGGTGIGIPGGDLFTGENGTLLNGGKGSILGVTDGIGGGGGGGLNQGGAGYGGFGSGGGLGITLSQIGNSVGTQGSASTAYTVSGGYLNIFSGSGGGGGIASILPPGLGSPGKPGKGVTVTGVITQNGGTVNLLGGVGGGGGLIATADGGKGEGSIVNSAVISNSNSVFNVFGGAGGGGNSGISLLGLLNTDGGDGEGGTLNSASVSGGTLNVFAGANGADSCQENEVLFGAGGKGTGGTVKNVTLTNNGTLNLYKGTSYGSRNTAGSGTGPTADAVTNNGGTVNLYGGTITGNYTQSAGTLNLAGGTFSATGKNFNGGTILSSVSGSTLTGITVGGAVTTGISGSGSSLTIDGATINAAGNLEIGNGVTLKNTALTTGGITLATGGKYEGNYSQSGGTLTLKGGTITGTKTFSGGSIVSQRSGETLDAASFTGTVTTDATGYSLTLTNSTIGSNAKLTVGTNVTLSGAAQSSATSEIILSTGGTLSGTYLQTDGTLTLAGGSIDGSQSTFQGGSVESTVSGATLNGATFDGIVATDASTAGSSLAITNANITSNANLTIGTNVTLSNATLNGGAIKLDNGGILSGTYTQTAGTLTLSGGTTDLTSATFSGGSITSDHAGSILNNAIITGDVQTTATGLGTLQLTDTVIKDTGKLTIGSGVTLTNATLTEGSIKLATGGTMDGTYKQTGGTLYLSGGTLAVTAPIVFSGGNINAEVNTTLSAATFDGTVTTVGSTGNLIIDDATVTSSGNLHIGDKVTLQNTELTTGTVTLNTGGTLASTYTQSGGTLVMNGGTAATGTDFSGGTINAIVSGSTLGGATFSGAVTTVADSGADLLLTGATVTSSGNLSIGQNVTLQNTTLTEGKITLNTGGELDGTYTQSGGTLILNGGDADNATLTFSGGDIQAAAAGSTMDGASFTGEVLTSATGSGDLTLTNATVSATGNLHLGNNVTLEDGNLTTGKITLDANGSLSGTYTQSGGTLVLNGGSTTGFDGEFSGGTIDSETSGAVLDDAKFTGSVTTTATGAGNSLIINNATVDGTGDLTIGSDVTLRNSTMEDGKITLDTDGTIDGTYTQNGGTLELSGGDFSASQATFSAGTIESQVAGATLDDATFTGQVTTIATGGNDLTLTNAHVTASGDLVIDNNVTLQDARLSNGSIEIAGTGKLEGSYTQTGGTLHLSGVNVAPDSATISGGVINAKSGTASFDGAKVTGDVSATASAGATLELDNTTVAGGKLDAGKDVTLKDTTLSSGGIALNTDATLSGTYTQTGGELELKGGAVTTTKITLSGGVVTAVETTTLKDAEVVAGSGVVASAANGKSLTFDDMVVNGGSFTAGDNVSLETTTTVNAGNLVLAGGTIKDVYTQTGGTLTLKSDTFNATTSTISGGSIHAEASGGATMDNVEFTGGNVSASASSGSGLSFTNANLNGASLTISSGVVFDGDLTLGTLENKGGDAILNSFGVNGEYRQSSGSLTLSGGITTPAGKTQFSGGTITTKDGQTATLNGALFVPGSSVRVDGGAGGMLNLFGANINGIEVTTGTNVTIRDVTVHNSGLISIQDGTTLGGITTLNTGGGIAFDGDTAGNQATIDDLDGSDGVLYFHVDANTGKGDYYTVNNATGSHQLYVIGVKAGMEIDLVDDVNNSGAFVLHNGDSIYYTEDSASLVENKLTSRLVDSSRIWSLNSREVGRTSTATGTENAPAVTQNQVTIGMTELGRHMRNLRDSTFSSRYGASEEGDACFGVMEPSTSGIWARTYMHHMTIDVASKATMNLYGLEGGFDKQINTLIPGTMNLGVVVGGQWLNKMRMNQSYSKQGTGHGHAVSAGLYGSWISDNNWFANVSARHFWTSTSLTNFDINDNAVRYNPKRNAIAMSAEAGRRVFLGQESRWYIEPRVGIMRAVIKDDNFTTSAKGQIHYDHTKAFQTTAALSVGYRGKRVSSYIEGAVTREFDGKTRVLFDTTEMESNPRDTRWMVGAGLNFDLTCNTSLYLDASYEKSSKFKDISGSAGISFSW